MTNDETILREVDQALAEDETSKSLRKNLPALAGAAIIVVLGVGGWQLWSSQREAAAAKASADYDAAMKETDPDKSAAALQSIADKGGAYAALASMRLAAEHALHGEREEALALYRKVYGSGAGSKRLKDMARLRAAHLSLADGREEVLKDVGPLETDETAIGHYARETLALAALKAGDYQTAEEMFRRAASSPDAPEAIRLRAAEFAALAGAGKAGVEFPAIAENEETGVDRYLESLEEAGSDLSSLVNEGGAGQETETPAEPPSDAAPQAPEGKE